MHNELKEFQMVQSILQKVYRAGGEIAVRRFVETDGEECPAVKLTPEEMEFCKGGGRFRDWFKAHGKKFAIALVTLAVGIATSNIGMMGSGAIGIIGEL